MTAKPTKSSSAKGRKTHGQLLEELYLWSGLSQQDFTQRFGKSATWFKKNREAERLFRKAIPPICRAFNIPPEYFEGTYILPKRLSAVNEVGPEYGNENLRQENEALKNEIIELNRQLIDVMKKYQALLEERN